MQKESATDALETASKGVVQKTAEAFQTQENQQSQTIKNKTQQNNRNIKVIFKNCTQFKN